MIGDSLPLIAIDTLERDGRTQHIFREIRGQALMGLYCPLRPWVWTTTM
jgi:hypothetical protein